MKRKVFLLAPLLVPVLAATSHAQNAELPLRQVVLFSSGVGYFSRAGQIKDNAEVHLNVRAPQISDLLKSLVLFDERGSVAPVSYAIPGFGDNRPRETDLVLGADATPGQILRTFRGAAVILTRKNGDRIAGRIVSVSSRVLPSEKGNYSVEMLNLSSTVGLQSVNLEEIESFQLQDSALQDKLQNALEKSVNALTSRLDDGVRSVKLRFNGKGNRNARAGYLLEMPTWKTSYRLVLEDKKPAFLQGWAVVENPTDADWNEVQLSLVAGRPISFIQNLSAPIFVTRPVVDSQIPGASAQPQTFGDGFGTAPGTVNTPRPTSPRLPIAPNLELSNRASGVFSNAGSYAMPELDEARREMGSEQIRGVDRVRAQASGSEAGELFVYAIDAKVTLPRGEAAMVPIVSQNVDGEGITIVESQNQFGNLVAQNGFCLRNRGELRLQGGPITVYNGGIYGGDALIQNVSPGEAKLIAYALDLDLVAKREADNNNYELLAIKSSGSQIRRETRQFLTQNYLLRNKSAKPKTVFLQQAALGDWQLVDEKQRMEKAIDGDRFRVELKPNETRNYEIKWKRTSSEAVAVGNFDFGNLDVYLRQNQITPALKAKLEIVAARKARIVEIDGQIAAQNASLKAISEDQNRLRENMRVLERSSKLYQNYEAKLGAQEERIAKIEAEIERLKTAKIAAQREFDAAIGNLD